MLLRNILLIVGTVLGSVAGYAQTRCPADKRADDVATRFVVSLRTVRLPIGAFLLVRKNGQVGAIRLTGIDPAATEWLGKSTWESFFQPDRSGSLQAKNVVRLTGELDVRSPKGVHSLYSYGAGQRDAHIGKWTFSFGSPTLMPMSDASFWAGRGDHGYEFAPTSACSLSEIDTTDKRLRWFRWDRSTQVTLPLADLPK